MQSPHESIVGPMDFGVKRSKVKVTMLGLRGQVKRFQAHKCFPFTPIFMKLHMQSPHESIVGPMDFGVKRSKVKVTMLGLRGQVKWFQAHKCFPFTPIFMKLHMQSPHESIVGPMDFGVKRSKVKVTMLGLRGQVKWFQAHICFPFTPIFMKLHMQSPHESIVGPMDFGVKRSKVKVTMLGLRGQVKWFQAYKCFPFTPIFMKLHVQSPHESSMGPMDFGVKRSKVKVTMLGLRGQVKWFQAHKCFPFTPIFMKLHMQSPHESSMGPMDFGVKRSKVKVTMQGLRGQVKWFQAHNCFPFTPIFMKLHMQSPHESSMDPMDFGVKRSKVKVAMQGLPKKDSGA